MTYITPRQHIEVNRDPSLKPEQIRQENVALLDVVLGELGDNNSLLGLDVLHDSTLLSVDVFRIRKFCISVSARPADNPEEDKAVYELARSSEGIKLLQLFPLTEKSDTDENQRLVYDVLTTGINAIWMQKEHEKAQTRGRKLGGLFGRSRKSS